MLAVRVGNVNACEKQAGIMKALYVSFRCIGEKPAFQVLLRTIV
jgi:hypothetical protein